MGEYATADGKYSASYITGKLCDVAEACSNDETVKVFLSLFCTVKVLPYSDYLGCAPLFYYSIWELPPPTFSICFSSTEPWFFAFFEGICSYSTHENICIWNSSWQKSGYVTWGMFLKRLRSKLKSFFHLNWNLCLLLPTSESRRSLNIFFIDLVPHMMEWVIDANSNQRLKKLIKGEPQSREHFVLENSLPIYNSICSNIDCIIYILKICPKDYNKYLELPRQEYI